MLPLYDSIEKRKLPYVTWFLILINLAVFAIALFQKDIDTFIHSWGFIPALFDSSDTRSYMYIFTSLFLHGSVIHLLTNVWFLHVFGETVEDRMGHLAYLIFYLLAGFAATMTQMIYIRWFNIPLIGASGAISGIAGAYLVFQYRSQVVTWLPLGNLKKTIRIHSLIALVYWVVLQLFVSYGTIGSVNYDFGNTVLWSHVGGFLFGIGFGLIMKSILRENRTDEKHGEIA